MYSGRQQFSLLTWTILLTTCASVVLVDSTSREWRDYKLKFGHALSDSIAEQQRESLFHSRLAQIRLHNGRYDAGLESYEMAVNMFTGMTAEERRQYTNHGGQDIGYSDAKVFRVEASGCHDIDWVKRGAVTGIKQQGPCGSCYTFASVVALEAQYFLKHGKLLDLSEQNLLDCAPGDCGGGYSRNCFEYVKNNGIMSEKAYPYEGDKKACRFNGTESVWAIADQRFVARGDEDQLYNAVYTAGPITVALDARHFFGYARGVLDKTDDCNDTNHLVSIVGTGTTDEGRDYYLCKNSWGEEWGEQGYIRIARQINYCSIADWANYPVGY